MDGLSMQAQNAGIQAEQSRGRSSAEQTGGNVDGKPQYRRVEHKPDQRLR
jgi:hypothetical protein